MCDRHANQGAPRLLFDDDCYYVFTWPTSAACGTNDHTGLGGFAIFMIVYDEIDKNIFVNFWFRKDMHMSMLMIVYNLFLTAT